MSSLAAKRGLHQPRGSHGPRVRTREQCQLSASATIRSRGLLQTSD